jgi:predicted nucleotidyltransferase
MYDRSQIDMIVNKIVAGYNPDKVILFGSYASGDANENSDLDFILVKNTGLPRHHRGKEVRKMFYGMAIPMDFKIYTQSEFKEESEKEYSFLHNVLKESQVLYEHKE